MSDRDIMNAKYPPNEGVDISYESIGFRDPVVRNVVKNFVKRSDVGFKKYGSTLHDERTNKLKDLAGYLNDIQEELMDAILYIQSARDEIEETTKQ